MSEHVLVMGGTRGLGFEIAKDAAMMGHVPYATGRSAYEREEDEHVRFLRQDFTKYRSAPLGDVRSILGPMMPRYVFWVGGVFLKGRLAECSTVDIIRMTETHLTGPVVALSKLHATMTRMKSPYHLIVIGSTSSYAIRENETVYCTLKGAKTAFARNFVRELVRELPGSKMTLVNTGAMKTDFFDGTDIDTTNLMDPAHVARIIWNRIVIQGGPWDAYSIENGGNGSVPVILDGLRPPEMPF